jgi:hypothetical protein
VPQKIWLFISAITTLKAGQFDRRFGVAQRVWRSYLRYLVEQIWRDRLLVLWQLTELQEYFELLDFVGDAERQ